MFGSSNATDQFKSLRRNVLCTRISSFCIHVLCSVSSSYVQWRKNSYVYRLENAESIKEFSIGGAVSFGMQRSSRRIDPKKENSGGRSRHTHSAIVFCGFKNDLVIQGSCQNGTRMHFREKFRFWLLLTLVTKRTHT